MPWRDLVRDDSAFLDRRPRRYLLVLPHDNLVVRSDRYPLCVIEPKVQNQPRSSRIHVQVDCTNQCLPSDEQTISTFTAIYQKYSQVPDATRQVSCTEAELHSSSLLPLHSLPSIVSSRSHMGLTRIVGVNDDLRSCGAQQQQQQQQQRAVDSDNEVDFSGHYFFIR